MTTNGVKLIISTLRKGGRLRRLGERLFENIIWISVLQALAVSIFFSILAILGLYIVFRQVKANNFSGADFGIAPVSATVKIKISIGALIFMVSSVMIVVTMLSHWWIVVAPAVVFGLSGKIALTSIKSHD